MRLSPETCRVKPLRRIKTQLLHLVGLISLAYDGWCFIDLIGVVNFRQEYVNKAVGERERPVSGNFKENIDKCVRLAVR